MGNASWSTESYATLKSSIQDKPRAQVFRQREIKEGFDPKEVMIRESCDSIANPNSNAIILGLDVTGSMGFIAEAIAKQGLGTLIEGILDKQPVVDPHIMVMAIGDVFCDRAPLQVTQFEADIRIAEQLTGLWLEGGGGGNDFESYDLPWAFAARKTKIDCFDKRNKKGYLFTIGDENPPHRMAGKDRLNESIGAGGQGDSSTEELLAEAQQRYDVFHVTIMEGNYAQRALASVTKNWNNLLGKKHILCKDYHHLPEIILSVIEVNEGKDPQEVIDSWQDAKIKATVQYALFGGGQ